MYYHCRLHNFPLHYLCFRDYHRVYCCGSAGDNSSYYYGGNCCYEKVCKNSENQKCIYSYIYHCWMMIYCSCCIDIFYSYIPICKLEYIRTNNSITKQYGIYRFNTYFQMRYHFCGILIYRPIIRWVLAQEPYTLVCMCIGGCLVCHLFISASKRND